MKREEVAKMSTRQMMKMMQVSLIAIMALVVIDSISTGILAADGKFPVRSIQVIIPFSPGDTDNQLRPFIEKLPEFIGQPLTFVYKPGGGGSLGAGYVASAKPDGYTLLGTAQSSIIINPLSQKESGYNWQSFAPISCLTEAPMILCVQSKARWKNLKELVADAKKAPGEITYSTSGTFGIGHILAEAMSKEARIKLKFIPSQGTGAAVTTLLGGHVQMVSSGLGAPLPHIRAGTLRVLAVFGKERLQNFPDVATCTEMGYPVALPVIYGLLGPGAIPKEVVETISVGLKKVVENHRDYIKDRLSILGAQINLEGPERYTATLKMQNEFFGEMFKYLKK
jgi:tripartite-type tricarboxylate transporter receptor subunit TctC